MTEPAFLRIWALLAAAASTACGGWIDVEPTAPFKILVLTTALDYRHPSITDCQRMLSELGETPDDRLPAGAKPGSRFTTEVATDDLADFTPAGLREYDMLFWCTPTGDVFSDNPRAPRGEAAMAALRDYVEGGGAWGGVHSATDFEKAGGFPWYTDTLLGGYLQSFDADDTAGIVQVEPGYAEHPVMRGVPATWSVRDEWFRMNREITEEAGFQIVSRLAADDRPVTWLKELGESNAGRMFYTIRGHAPSVYAEPEFRQLVHNGILWATRRLDP